MIIGLFIRQELQKCGSESSGKIKAAGHFQIMNCKNKKRDAFNVTLFFRV
jgi:hypothetical protein